MTKTNRNELEQFCKDYKRMPVVNRLYFLIHLTNSIEKNFNVRSIKKYRQHADNIKQLIYRDYIKDRKSGKVTFHTVKRLKECKEYSESQLRNQLNALAFQLMKIFVEKAPKTRITQENSIPEELRMLGNMKIANDVKYSLELLKKISK